MTSFSFFKYSDAFELVNVVDFVYYGKTRMIGQFKETIPIFLKIYFTKS